MKQINSLLSNHTTNFTCRVTSALDEALEGPAMEYDGIMVGSILRELRECSGLSAYEVCAYLEISTSTLWHIEQGGRPLTMKNMFKLMSLYGVDANTILGIEDVGNLRSVDARLSLLPFEQQQFFRGSFLYTLNHAHELERMGA